MKLKGRTIWVRAKVVDEERGLLSLYGLERIKIYFDEYKRTIADSNIKCLAFDDEVKVEIPGLVKMPQVGDIYQNTSDRYVQIVRILPELEKILYIYFDDHKNKTIYSTSKNSILAWRLFKRVDEV